MLYYRFLRGGSFDFLGDGGKNICSTQELFVQMINKEDKFSSRKPVHEIELEEHEVSGAARWCFFSKSFKLLILAHYPPPPPSNAKWQAPIFLNFI